MEPVPKQENGLLAATARGGDLRHLMSGRCGIMLAIAEIAKQDTKRVAYLPAYTCETVSGCFVKSGYEIIYYDVDTKLHPQYDESLLDRISLFLACGYYGFVTFEEQFASLCRASGVVVLCDATHSLFSAGGVPKSAHYMAVSLRKWLPVPAGGLAVKYHGQFQASPVQVHSKHLEMRRQSLTMAQKAAETQDEALLKEATTIFWDAEMLLRRVYGCHEGDPESEIMLSRYPIEEMCRRRRSNYMVLLENFPKRDMVRPVFTALPEGTVPSHFTVYAKDRDALQEALDEKGIGTTAYWPVPPFIDIQEYPGAAWVYEHVLSLPCDQRYGKEQMLRMASVLRETAV